jgi:ribosomal protein S18 acetylase RimI-like enzyme
MSNFTIRRATSKDAELLSELSAETFWETYSGNPNSDNDDIRSYMKKTYAVELLEEELESESIVFLVAEVDGETAGYARLLMGSRVDGVEGKSPMEISRIYLLARFHGGGHGRTLLEACMGVARKRGCGAVWLSVWKFNPKAIGFYRRMGFRDAGTTTFDLAGTLHEDLLMVREIAESES